MTPLASDHVPREQRVLTGEEWRMSWEAFIGEHDVEDFEETPTPTGSDPPGGSRGMHAEAAAVPEAAAAEFWDAAAAVATTSACWICAVVEAGTDRAAAEAMAQPWQRQRPWCCLAPFTRPFSPGKRGPICRSCQDAGRDSEPLALGI